MHEELQSISRFYSRCYAAPLNSLGSGKGTPVTGRAMTSWKWRQQLFAVRNGFFCLEISSVQGYINFQKAGGLWLGLFNPTVWSPPSVLQYISESSCSNIHILLTKHESFNYVKDAIVSYRHVYPDIAVRFIPFVFYMNQALTTCTLYSACSGPWFRGSEWHQRVYVFNSNSQMRSGPLKNIESLKI